jgi:CheY-like chemotaxis protein
MDGFEVARHLRELLGRRVLLVALTGWGQDEDRRRSREAGFGHHLTKPPEPEVLDRLIVECMQKRGA